MTSTPSFTRLLLLRVGLLLGLLVLGILLIAWLGPSPTRPPSRPTQMQE